MSSIMRRTRLMPPVHDYHQVRRSRQEEVAKVEVTEDSEPEVTDEDSEPEVEPTELEDNGLCQCLGKTTKAKTRKKNSEKQESSWCLFSLGTLGHVGESGFTMCQMMATQACYIPMVQANYQFVEVHVLALWGIDRESDLIEYIKSLPGSLKSRDSAGNTVLILACVARHPSRKVISTILEKSSKEAVNAQNNDGLTALHFAVLNRQAEIVQALLDHNADVNAGRVKVRGKYYGLTPLLMSVTGRAGWNDVDCLEVLLRYEPDLSVETVISNYSSSDNLHFFNECDCGGCSSERDVSLGSVLPPSKIKTLAWTSTGCAAFHATRNNLGGHLHMLLNRFEDRNQLGEVLSKPTPDRSLTLFPVAAVNHCFDSMKVLTSKEPSVVNQTCSFYRGQEDVTPLHILLSAERRFNGEYRCAACLDIAKISPKLVVRVFSELLDCDSIDVEARTRTGETPLMLAAQNGHDYILEKLLDLGADPMAVNDDGCTAAVLALGQEPGICLKVLGVLFQTGLSHEIYKESFADSVILKEVCKKRDTQILDLFYQTGALSDSNRVAMLQAAEKATVTGAEQEKQAKFVQALTKANPWSLKRCTLMYVSARAGLGSPKRRAQALKRILGELMDEGKAAPNQDDCPGNVESQNIADEQDCRIVLDVPPSDIKQQHLTEEQQDGICEMVKNMLIDCRMGLPDNAKSAKS